MTWWVVPIAVLAAWLLYQAIRAGWREHDRHLQEINAIHRKALFDVATQERETLEKIIADAHVRPRPSALRFRKPRSNESPWDYAKNIADWGGLGIKPWQPGFTHLCSEQYIRTWIEVYTTTLEGVVHRVGKIGLQDGMIAHVLICEPTTLVEGHVKAHEKDECPTITCLSCITKAS